MDRGYWLRKFERPTSVAEVVVNVPAELVVLAVVLVLGPFFYGVYILDQKHEKWSRKRREIRLDKMTLRSEIKVIENENRLRRETRL